MGLCDGSIGTWAVVKQETKKWSRWDITMYTDSQIMGNYCDEASARKSLRKIVVDYLDEDPIYDDGWLREVLINDRDLVCIVEYQPSIHKTGFSAPKVEHRIGLVIFSITRIF